MRKKRYPINIQSIYSDKEGTKLLADDDYESTPFLLKIDDRDLEKK